MVDNKCKSNTPEACPYHGVKIRYENSLQTYMETPTSENFNRTLEDKKDLDRVETNKELTEKLLNQELFIGNDTPQLIKYEDRLEYRVNNRLHNSNGPAIQYINGNNKWYQDGRLHREDGPAVEDFINKKYEYWIKGSLHRVDGPAVIYPDGTTEWYQNGLLHHDNKDEPAIKYSNGNQEYWSKGELIKMYFMVDEI